MSDRHFSFFKIFRGFWQFFSCIKSTWSPCFYCTFFAEQYNAISTMQQSYLPGQNNDLLYSFHINNYWRISLFTIAKQIEAVTSWTQTWLIRTRHWFLLFSRAAIKHVKISLHDTVAICVHNFNQASSSSNQKRPHKKQRPHGLSLHFKWPVATH